MKHIIVVDDRTKAGKNLLELAEILAKGDKNIRMITEDEEDKALLKKMLAARKTGILDTSEKERFIKQLKALADV